MLLNIADTKFVKCSSVVIPQEYFNRMVTGCDEVDLIFGSEHLKGLVAGSTITITGTPGAGKCHAGDQIIEIFADDSIIEDIKHFLSTRTSG
jgi:predicted ATP-dependent serine protease